MKPFFVWQLIAMIICHWAGSYIGFKVIYSVELKSEMNHVEKKIAEAVKDETNLELHITVLSEDQILTLSNGYGNYSVFSKEVDGQTVYYQVEEPSTELVIHEYTVDTNSNPNEKGNIALLENLFSKYTIPKFQFLAGILQLGPPILNYWITDLQDLLIIPVITPPPQLIES